jgi:hypothetical protein
MPEIPRLSSTDSTSALQLMSSKTGQIVSTSEIAKQFLESAREERMEVADLMADPTETLLQIRRKGEAEHVLCGWPCSLRAARP